MNPKAKIALSLATLIGGAVLASYYRNVNALTIGFKTVKDFTFDPQGNIQLTLVLQVDNPTGSTFPVPTVTADVFADTDYLGYAEAVQVQYIEPYGISYLELVTHISIESAGPFVYATVLNLINSQELPQNMSVMGQIHLFLIDFPFNETLLGTTTPATT